MQKRSDSNLLGIDVSHHNGTIDWNAVITSGVKFVFIKATEGIGYTDPKFRANADGANRAGLQVGFYHYARPETGNTAISEAVSFTKTINGVKAELPHVLDLEGAASKLGRTALTRWAVDWLKEVKKITGHNVMLYTGASFAKTYCGPELGQFPLWVAHYGVQQPLGNQTWSRWSVFQFTETGRVNGIRGNVDMNVMEANFVKSSDIEGHWAEQAIKEVMEAGIMSGRSNSGFSPNEPLTRAEAAVIVNRILKKF
ncbi:MAG: GH25 family lysozyme [Paenibacillus dendritiformis]|uniref:GH25 family lysozyme n=1 Tax=uncultured Paenibacillus sp. TaxID=227322 RepID=UPI0025DD9650|nr:GH25 family lysozyme [uncultured Paenibacillus sp.]MDU5141048.1 GH25 family lysozyme [Paenibacillus dendritiformis]